MDIFEKCNQRYIQDEVRDLGIYPYFHALESRQDTEVIMEGKRRIMLGSNNYLGLTTNEAVVKAGMHAYETLGSGCSGSRFLNGTLKLHLELEDELAKFLRKDAVVTFSTGFQSNLGIISAIVGLHDYVIMDRENHASLYDGCKLSYGKMLRYQHNDMADLEKKLQKVPETAGCLIVTDGVFSMGGDIANLPEICALAQKYGARVMVDDAHGLGVIGEGGRGTASYYGLEDHVDIYMGTFSKSLASLGGYMASSSRVADFVRHSSRPFIFSASIPPANAAAALAACTGDFESFNTNPDAVQSVDKKTYITTMQMDAVIPCSDVGANEFQRACNLMGDAFGGYLSPIQAFNGGSYTCTYDLDGTDYNNVPFSVAFTNVMPAWLNLKYAYQNGQVTDCLLYTSDAADEL